MGIMDEMLWIILKEKVEEEDQGLPADRQFGSEYLTGIKAISKFGVDRAKTIRDSFPMYTLHDETHICNVMRLIIELLGDYVRKLSRDEAAMLVLAACCHDIGMSYSDDDKLEILADLDRLNKYLDRHHSEYVKAYTRSIDKPEMTDDMIQNYLRSIHHERIMDLLCNSAWPTVLEGKVNREDLILVCQSHGNDITSLNELEQTPTIDLRFCAVMLRLADILDFDTSRAPQAVYDYSGIGSKESAGLIISREEWNKHMASHGFDFEHITDRSYPYILNYSATSKSMQIEQTINSYLDWVDQELGNCGKQIKRFTGKWHDLILPVKIKRNIKSEGYVSGQYRLTLDQNQIMELLVGKDLYSDPSVFVRELIQNAIDAVRTRKQLDKNLPSDWKPQVNIRSWMDDEGYHWFRIEDNGIGMTEDTIMNFFLKIGRSYYISDLFYQEKLRCKADPDYMPISRFGIGILSCFMGDEHTNQVEVSTKHFNENGVYYPALRLSMHGINGYYYMASKEKNHLPGPMKGVSAQEKEQYLKQAGTVIAVRTNLYQTGKYRGFKEIIDRYVVYPSVAIHYDGMEGAFDYPSEADFMTAIHEIQPSDDLSQHSLEFSLSDEQLQELHGESFKISFEERPRLLLKCIPLDHYTESPYLSGAVLTAAAIGKHKSITIPFGKHKEQADVNVGLYVNRTRDELGIGISLDFSEDFSERMKLIERNYHNNNHHIFDQLFSYYKKDDYRLGIADALYHEHINSSKWKNYMKSRYDVPLSELKKTIEEVEYKLRQIGGYSAYSREDIANFVTYKGLRREWEFTLCKLSQFDWYMKYFINISNNTGMFSVAAHNGILCGNADFFFKSNYMEQNLGTIVLLKDKYRPDVDVARDNIRQLTLETASDLEIIRSCIRDQGFSLPGNMEKMEEAGYSYLPMKRYWSLLEERADLKNKMMIETDKDKYTVEELSTKIQEYGKLKIKRPPKLSNFSKYSDKNCNLYDYLCIAYLRKNYFLRTEFNKYNNDIYILAKESGSTKEYENIFPTTFFLVPLNPHCQYLTIESHYYRCTCNANHRFSIWIQANCEKLNKHVPGIFKEMLRDLAEEDGKQLMQKINELLSRLRQMPGDLFNFPDEIFLTEKDLC